MLHPRLSIASALPCHLAGQGSFPRSSFESGGLILTCPECLVTVGWQAILKGCVTTAVRPVELGAFHSTASSAVAISVEVQ